MLRMVHVVSPRNKATLKPMIYEKEIFLGFQYEIYFRTSSLVCLSFENINGITFIKPPIEQSSQSVHFLFKMIFTQGDGTHQK